MKKLLSIILLLLCLTASVSHSQSFKMFGQLLNTGHWSTDGLVFYWRAIEAVEVVDESLYGNHGTITGATWVGNALSFDASGSDFVEIGILDKSGWTGITIIARVKLSLSGSAAYVIASDWNINQGTVLFRFDHGTTFLEVEVSEQPNTSRFVRFTDFPINSDVWYTVAVTIKYNGLIEGYVDGRKSTNSIGFGSIDSDVPAANMRFGTSAHAPSVLALNGQIADIKIYTRALSASEIAALYINPALPMQQDPIWLFQPPPAVVTGQVIIITKHEKKSTIMSMLSDLWEGIWSLV